MSSGYIIGVTEKGKPKKKRVRPANLRVSFEESEDQKSAKKTKTNVSSPFGSFDISLPFADQTNIVYFDIVSQQIKAEALLSQLGNKGIKILLLGPSRFRAVTHYGINVEDIDFTLAALGEIMKL